MCGRGVACVPAQGLVCLQHGLDESSPYAASFRACHPSGRTEGLRPSVFLLHPPRLEVRGLKSRASNGGQSPTYTWGLGSAFATPWNPSFKKEGLGAFEVWRVPDTRLWGVQGAKPQSAYYLSPKSGGPRGLKTAWCKKIGSPSLSGRGWVESCAKRSKTSR